MKTTATSGAGNTAALRSARDQQFVDSNVENFARVISDLAGTNGFRVKADTTLGAKPNVTFTVGSEQDAAALREVFADKDAMSMNGLSGVADFSGEKPVYTEPGWLKDGVSFSIQVGEVPKPVQTAPVSPPREDGWQNNIGPDGVARMNTPQEFVQSNVRSLGQELKRMTGTQGLPTRVEQDGTTGLRITVADQATADQVASLLLDPKKRELSSFTGKLEAAGEGRFRYSDDGWLKHGVAIELKVGSLQVRQLEY